MLYPGLVSVTFRNLSPREIISLVVRSGLKAVEWGGDIHVPCGDLDTARRVRRMTEDSGLKVASYGSYYKLGSDDLSEFSNILKTAVELGAPTIRVWAGQKGSVDADKDHFDSIVEESEKIADMAAKEKIIVAYEIHKGTLTDTNDSARKLLEAVGHKSMKTYWQPFIGADMDYCLDGLNSILPWLANIHIYTWDQITNQPSLLATGQNAWSNYLQRISSTGREHFVMLEFVKDNDPEIFLNDAETLLNWLHNY